MHTTEFIIFCLVYGFGVIYPGVNASDIQGYYWRDYKGELPDDALAGGMENGITTFIGQVLHKELLIPAKILPTEQKAYYEWGGVEYSTSKNIKIFCTNHPEQFEWYKGTSYDFDTKAKNLVEVGYEPDATLYVGRTYTEGELVLGKLLVNDYTVLHISKDGKGVPKNLFEVLAYSKDKSTSPVDHKIVINQSSKCEKKPVTVNFYCTQ